MSNKKVSNLIVKLDSQLLSEEEWDSHTPMNFELWDGMPFSNKTTLFRDRLLLALLYSAGIKHTLSLLPEKSLDLLKEELEEDWRDIVVEADRLARERFIEEQELHGIARKLIENGMSVEEVTTVTGLSKDDVSRIVNKTM